MITGDRVICSRTPLRASGRDDVAARGSATGGVNMPNRSATLVTMLFLLPLLLLALYPGSAVVSTINADPPVSQADAAPLWGRGLHQTQNLYQPQTSLVTIATDRGSSEPVSSVSTPNADDAFEIASAERLAVRFQGYPDLTRDYRIRGDGSISIPVVGRVV